MIVWGSEIILIIGRMKFHLKRKLETYPKLFLTVMRTFKENNSGVTVIDDDCDLVIEGFPRSANTFAYVAFKYPDQNEKYRVAHHLHSTAQVQYAINKQIPTLVLIRKPLDAVKSLLVREDYMTPRMALNWYSNFYGRLASDINNFVVGTFSEVTSNFGGVIQKINEKYDLNFALFEHADKNEKICFDRIENMDKRDRGSSRISEDSVARPSEKRKKKKENINLGEVDSSCFERAKKVYKKYTTSTSSADL